MHDTVDSLFAYTENVNGPRVSASARGSPATEDCDCRQAALAAAS